MMEAKDFISLLATIDLGILAATLTLLAIYPAIALSIDASRASLGAGDVIDQEKRRRSIFRWLGIAGIAAFLALAILTVDAMGFAIRARPGETVTICCLPAPETLATAELWMQRLAAVVSLVSLFGVGKSGLAILRLAKDAA